MSADYLCKCGHWDSEHVCSNKAHERKSPEHICNVTDRTFCCNEDVADAPWSCRCESFRIDNLRYLEGLENKRELSA